MLLLYASVFTGFFGIGSHMKPNGLITWIIAAASVVCVVVAYGFSIVT